MPLLKKRNYNGWTVLENKDVGYGAYFLTTLSTRVRKKKATNIAVTGEAGDGKSYLTFDICRALEGLTASGNDRFKLNQIVFTYKQFMKATILLPMGKPIMFDEPSYAIGKREWYKELNKALVKTIESFRFKVHPLFIPIINKALIDKTVRTYLLQYQVELRDRGLAWVYRLKASQSIDKSYRYRLWKLKYRMFDWDKCKRESCLDCKKIDNCELFRAKYERKKASIQDVRYEQSMDLASKTESKLYTTKQLAELLYPLRERYLDEDNHIDVKLMRLVARDELDVNIGHSRSYDIRTELKYRHPKEFS